VFVILFCYLLTSFFCWIFEASRDEQNARMPAVTSAGSAFQGRAYYEIHGQITKDEIINILYVLIHNILYIHTIFVREYCLVALRLTTAASEMTVLKTYINYKLSVLIMNIETLS